MAVVTALVEIGTTARSQEPWPRPLVTGRNGMVTSNHPLASAAGMRVLMSDGSAFGSAVATAAATSVMDPSNAA